MLVGSCPPADDIGRRPANIARRTLRANMLNVVWEGWHPQLGDRAYIISRPFLTPRTRLGPTSTVTLVATGTTMSRLVSVLGVYRKFPRELFRLNKGPHIRLRECKSRRGPLFDVVANGDGNIESWTLRPTPVRPSPSVFVPFDTEVRGFSS